MPNKTPANAEAILPQDSITYLSRDAPFLQETERTRMKPLPRDYAIVFMSTYDTYSFWLFFFFFGISLPIKLPAFTPNESVLLRVTLL